MAEATSIERGEIIEIIAENSLSEGQVVQIKDGRAGIATASATAGDPALIRVYGNITIIKTSGMVILNGGEVYWDHSANAAHYKTVNDRDFFVGCCIKDTTSTQTTIEVSLNVRPTWAVDVFQNPVLTVPVGTQGWNTMGAFRRGGCSNFVLGTTNEAQKLDILSIDGFAVAANAIVEAVFCVVSNGGGTNTDVSVGVASATHASDADSIAEHVFVHLNADTDLNIYAQSKDGSTTVTATDTTIDYAEGSAVAARVTVWFDLRDPADVQIYVNGANVLASTVFNVNAAVGPFFLLAHVEKASSADAYELCLHTLRCRIAEQ